MTSTNLPNTTLSRSDDSIVVTFWHTPIVTIDFATKTVTLRNGGHVTATTCKRMNQIAEMFSLPYRVGRKNFEMVWSPVVDGVCQDENNSFVNNMATLHMKG